MKPLKFLSICLMFTLFGVTEINAQNAVLSGSFQFTNEINRRTGIITLQSGAQKFDFPISDNIVIANLLPGRYSLVIEYQGVSKTMTKLSQTVDIDSERRTICRMNASAMLSFAKELDRNSVPIFVQNSHGHNDYFDHDRNNNHYDNHHRPEPPTPQAVSESDFNRLYHSVKNEKFSESKMQTLKTGSNFYPFFTSEQVKKLALLFDMDDDKLECAKYLTSKVLDAQNLTFIKDAFTFNSTKNAYLRFLNER